MFRDYWTTAKHAAIYGFGTVGYRLAGFLLLPLYTHKIPVSQYGLYGALEVLGQLLVGVLSFGLPTAMFKWLSEAEDEGQRRVVVSTTLSLMVLANLAVLVPLYAVGVRAVPLLAQRFHEAGLTPHQFLILLSAFLLDVFLTGVVRFQLNLLRAEEKPAGYTAVSLLRFLVVIGITIYFVGVLDLGIVGIYLGQVSGSALVLLLLLAYLLRRVAPRIRRDWISALLRYGVPLSFVSISVLLLNLGNRFFVEHYASLAELGRYTLGQKIGNIVNVVLVQPFTFAYFPLMWRFKDSNPDFIRKATTYFVLIGMWAFVGFALFGKEVTALLARTSQYQDAYKVVPLVAFASVSYGLVYLLQSPFYLSGKTQWIAIGFSLGLVVNVVFNILAVPRWGSIAAAVSISFSYLAVAALSYPVGRRYWSVGFEAGKVLATLAGAVAFAWLVLRFAPASPVGGLVTRGLAFLAFPLLAAGSGALDRGERAALQTALAGLLRR